MLIFKVQNPIAMICFCKEKPTNEKSNTSSKVVFPKKYIVWKHVNQSSCWGSTFDCMC